MADRLAAIRKLLAHERQDRRCAAAIVLAELGASDARTIKSLTEALSDGDSEVRRYAIEALGQTDSAASVDAMVPLLIDEDVDTRGAAEVAILRLGDEAIPALSKLLEGPTSSRRAAATMLTRLQSAAGLDMLLDSVDGTDSAVVDRARRTLRDKAPGLALHELRALRKKLEARLTDCRRAGDHPGAASLLQLLGDLPDETVVTRILTETDPSVPAAVRRVAIMSLATAFPLARGRRREAAIEKLLDYLGEEDEDDVVRPTLRVLGDVEVPQRLTDKLKGLLEAHSAPARAFALGKLGSLGTPDSIETLVDQLLTGSPPVRKAAQDALATLPEAAGRLAAALAGTADPERLREVAELLKRHGDTLSEKDAKALCEEVLDRAEKNDDEARPLMERTCSAVPSRFMPALRERVARNRKRESYSEAIALLKAAERCPAFGDDERYVLAILGLQLYSGDSKRPLRRNDRLCLPFAELLRNGFPVEAHLVKEPLVEADNLYQLGFVFAESPDEDERDLGHDLLEEVVERAPDSKIGRAAQNKLKLAGR